MKVSDIIDEVAEATGTCADDAILYTRITRGIELLANKQLIDPLIGTYEFTVTEGRFVACPRDCKTIIKININDSPTFGRSRLFEFTLNTDGTPGESDEPGLMWRDHGYLPIQDEKKLPGVLQYKATNAADNGKTLTAYGLDEDGREISETVTAHATDPVAGTKEFHKINRVSREATAYETFLWCNGSNVIAQYYGDETEPEYRIIKVSQAPASVRMLYRRHVFAVTTADSFIPMHSASAVIQAAKAADYYGKSEDEEGDKCMARAEKFMREEQQARDEHNDIAEQTEIPTATNTNLGVLDCIVVGDVYDKAAEIFGPVGRKKLFDNISVTCAALANKSHWDPGLGTVDVYSVDNTEEPTYCDGDKGHGLFVLPRFCGTPIQINICGRPLIPRNKWFEYHINSFGERNEAPCRAWDDQGDVCITRPLPLDGDEPRATRRTKPVWVVAVPDSDADDETEVRVFGLERVGDRDVEVWRGGAPGWVCPCVNGSYDPGDNAPKFTKIDRITVGDHAGFIKFYTLSYTPESTEETVLGEVTVVGGEQFRFEQATDEGDPDEPFAVGDGILVGGEEYEVVSISLFSIGGGVATWAVEVVAPFAGEVGDEVALSVVVPEVWAPALEIGYWYPDENEPVYRMIKLPTAEAKRIRVLYRRRAQKFTSFYEPIPLRSHLAIEYMMRAIKTKDADPVAAREYEADAKRYLQEARIKDGPSDVAALQFDGSVMPMMRGFVN